MSSDDLYHYAVRLKEAERLIGDDEKIHAATRTLGTSTTAIRTI